MKRVILILVCAAVAASYPTDSPISESPNIVLASPDDMENVAALDISESSILEDEDCEPEKDISPVSIKRTEEQDQSPPARRRCSNRNFVRLGRGSNIESDSGLDSSGDKDMALLRLGRGGRTNDNFIRFGRGGRSNDNFIRFGRGGKQDNFIRFGRDRSDSFIRFGRGRTDNFIRFGRGRSDNFIRLGRGKSDNFIRFGRAKPDNFIRFGRGKQDNFIRFGRGMRDNNFLRFGRDGTENLENTDLSSDELSSTSNLRVGRGGKPDSNFIRFGRARPESSNFIRLGRGKEELIEREERAKPNSNFVRFGRQAYDNFIRLGRSSGNSNDLRRGKLTDRNFIRLGRSGQEYENSNDGEESDDDDNDNSIRLGRSENPGNSRNFIRLGKRADDVVGNDHLVRFGRDVEQIGESPILSSGGDSTQNDNDNKTKEEYQHPRLRRSTYSGDDEALEDSSDYPIMIGNSAYDDVKMPTSTLDDGQVPFRYYSPLASGIPNYILGPELSVLPPISNNADSKRGKGDGHNRNYIRLG